MKPSLIIRLPNWIGDAIMCLPALLQLQKLNIPLILLGRPWIHELFKHLDIPMLSCPKSKNETITVLKTIPAKNILLFTNSFSSAMVARLAGKKSIGYACDGRRFLLTHAIPKPINFHETDVFNHLTQEMLKCWFPNLKPVTFALNPSIDLPNKVTNIPKPYIVLCPFAHGKSPEGLSKKWPHWEALSHELKAFHPIICPGPNELEEAQNLYPHLQQLAGLKLDEYLYILSQADIIIANDSGPMHMAAATSRPTLALFGTTSEKRTAPRNAITLGKKGQWPSLEEVLNAFYAYHPHKNLI
jgi:heptosyltransferase-2